MVKSDANPMQSAHAAPRCTAHSKRSGVLCKNPAVRGWAVCRMHGAGGGCRSGNQHPNYSHGTRTKSSRDLRDLILSFRNVSSEGVISYLFQDSELKFRII